MEAFTSLPGWAQLLIALLAAAILVVLNVGWLLQARAWLDGQRQKMAAQREAERGSAGRTPGANPTADRR